MDLHGIPHSGPRSPAQVLSHVSSLPSRSGGHPPSPLHSHLVVGQYGNHIWSLADGVVKLQGHVHTDQLHTDQLHEHGLLPEVYGGHCDRFHFRTNTKHCKK